MTSQLVCSCSEPWILLKFLGGNIPDDQSLHSSRLMDIAIDANQELSGLSTEMINFGIKRQCLEYYSDLVRNGFSDSWHNASYFLDKTPRYLYIWESIASLFPSSKFIVLNRDIKSIIVSYITTWCNGSFEGFLSEPHLQRDFTAMYPLLKKLNREKKGAANFFFVEFQDLIDGAKANNVLRSLEKFLLMPERSLSLDYGFLGKQDFRMGDPRSVDKLTKPENMQRSTAAIQLSRQIDKYLQAM